MRVGIGFDVHPLCEGRKLILGNVEIPSPLGLQGHSDADVLLHAVTDAVLGALAWGDIGQWFPDSDPQYYNINSALLFAEVWKRATAEGWKLGNCDNVVIAQRPKIAPYVPQMRQRLAELFDCELSQVNLKATTTERLGAIGREEGIAVQSVVLLVR